MLGFFSISDDAIDGLGIVNTISEIDLAVLAFAWTGQSVTADISVELELALESGEYGYVGQTLIADAIENIDLDAMDLAWIGAALDVEAQTEIALDPADMTWTGAGLSGDGDAQTVVILGALAFAWSGKSVSLTENEINIVLDPMDLSWRGADLRFAFLGIPERRADYVEIWRRRRRN